MLYCISGHFSVMMNGILPTPVFLHVIIIEINQNFFWKCILTKLSVCGQWMWLHYVNFLETDLFGYYNLILRTFEISHIPYLYDKYLNIYSSITRMMPTVRWEYEYEKTCQSSAIYCLYSSICGCWRTKLSQVHTLCSFQLTSDIKCKLVLLQWYSDRDNNSGAEVMF